VSNLRELNGNALREYKQLCRDTLEAVQREALDLERYPEGAEERGSTVVDGHEVPVPRKRIRGKLTVRW
jgi:hypothetical protein